MPPAFVVSVICILAALTLYSYAVWGEQLTHQLRRPFIVAFWLGFACDTTGTSLMARMARSEAVSPSALHFVTGLLAIVLMGVHAMWAATVWRKGQDTRAARLFHRFSRYVYGLWLIAFFSGMFVSLV